MISFQGRVLGTTAAARMIADCATERVGTGMGGENVWVLQLGAFLGRPHVSRWLTLPCTSVHLTGTLNDYPCAWNPIVLRFNPNNPKHLNSIPGLAMKFVSCARAAKHPVIENGHGRMAPLCDVLFLSTIGNNNYKRFIRGSLPDDEKEAYMAMPDAPSPAYVVGACPQSSLRHGGRYAKALGCGNGGEKQ